MEAQLERKNLRLKNISKIIKKKNFWRQIFMQNEFINVTWSERDF